MTDRSPWDNPAACTRARELLDQKVKRSRIAAILNEEFGTHTTGSAVSSWANTKARELTGRHPPKQKPAAPVFPPLKAPRRGANRLSTRFVRTRREIPDEVRTANVSALLGAAKKLTVTHPAISADYRHQAALWMGCETSFAAYDVEAASPMRAAADSRPYRWEAERRDTIVPTVSALGAVAGAM